MRKGMIFSADAILGLVAVIILIAWIPLQMHGTGEKGEAYESIVDRARDRAVIGFYGIEFNDEPNAVENISNAADFGRCYIVYTLNPDNAIGERAKPERNRFCEEIG